MRLEKEVKDEIVSIHLENRYMNISRICAKIRKKTNIRFKYKDIYRALKDYVPDFKKNQRKLKKERAEGAKKFIEIILNEFDTNSRKSRYRLSEENRYQLTIENMLNPVIQNSCHLSEATGLSRQILSLYVQGKRIPSEKYAKKICNALNLDYGLVCNEIKTRFRKPYGKSYRKFYMR